MHVDIVTKEPNGIEGVIINLFMDILIEKNTILYMAKGMKIIGGMEKTNTKMKK